MNARRHKSWPLFHPWLFIAAFFRSIDPILASIQVKLKKPRSLLKVKRMSVFPWLNLINIWAWPWRHKSWPLGKQFNPLLIWTLEIYQQIPLGTLYLYLSIETPKECAHAKIVFPRLLQPGGAAIIFTKKWLKWKLDNTLSFNLELPQFSWIWHSILEKLICSLSKIFLFICYFYTQKSSERIYSCFQYEVSKQNFASR